MPIFGFRCNEHFPTINSIQLFLLEIIDDITAFFAKFKGAIETKAWTEIRDLISAHITSNKRYLIGPNCYRQLFVISKL